MSINFFRASSQSIAESVLNEEAMYEALLDNRTFEERYKEYEEKTYDAISNLSEKERAKVYDCNGKLNSLCFEMGMKAGIMLAIDLELDKGRQLKQDM